MVSLTEDKYKLLFLAIAYFSIFALIAYIYSEIILAANDPKAFTKNFLYYIFMIVVPVILIFGVVSFLSFKATFTSYLVFGSLFIVGVVISAAYFLQSSLSKYIFNKYLLYIVTAFILIIGLSIIVTLFSGTLRKLSGWTGFFINLLFYLPCLIRDGIQNLIQEYHSFSTTLVVLFVTEIFLLILYFFLIPFVNHQIFPKYTKLITDPVMLNTGQPIKIPDKTGNNFAISMWVYINPGSINKPSYSVESPIFSYLNNKGVPHIKLTYSNIEQGNNDFIMYVGEQQFPISLPLQKWNHFVFNYVTFDNPPPTSSPTPTTTQNTSLIYTNPVKTKPPATYNESTVDMFVNGNLERSFNYKNPIPIFSSTTDTMTIGGDKLKHETITTAPDGVEGTTGNNSNKDGLYGAICNVVYYEKPLTKMALIYHYNLYTIRNPPV